LLLILIWKEYWLQLKLKELTDGQQHPHTIIPESVPDFPVTVTKK